MIELDNQANSDVVYFDGTNWVRLEKGEADDILTVNEDATAPQWGPLCVFPGTQYGYVCGGFLGKWPDCVSGPNVAYGSQIQKISLTTDGNSTDIGDILSARRSQSGHSSSTHGFVVGGYVSQAPSSLNIIERFSFTTDGNSTDWADLTTALNTSSVPASSCTHGFSFGGQNGTNTNTKIIDKFPFASQTNATDWAECSVAQYAGAGCSSELNGYACGSVQHAAPGIPSGTVLNNIDKYPYATQTNSTDIGNLVLLRYGGAGVSSETDGYIVGGLTVGTNPGNSAPLWQRTNIDKFSFSSGTQNAVDHGDLPLEASAGASGGTGMSGETHGYHAGGIYSWNIHNHQYAREQIEKFAYASNVTASDVGDLVQVGSTVSSVCFGMNGGSGHQF